MPVNLNFIVKKGNHSAPSSILQTTQNFKLQGIKYIKKQDKSQGANTYMQLLHSKIDEEVPVQLKSKLQNNWV